MKHELPPLPYDKNALAPHISAETLEFHHGKHHLAYVTNLNNLVTGTPFENATLEQIVTEASGPVFNNAAQVWNHTFYWRCLAPKGGGDPQGALAEALAKAFGSINAFREQFTKTAVGTFGSGWGWLGPAETAPESKFLSLFTGGLRRGGCGRWEEAAASGR